MRSTSGLLESEMICDPRKVPDAPPTMARARWAPVRPAKALSAFLTRSRFSLSFGPAAGFFWALGDLRPRPRSGHSGSGDALGSARGVGSTFDGPLLGS